MIIRRYDISIIIDDNIWTRQLLAVTMMVMVLPFKQVVFKAIRKIGLPFVTAASAPRRRRLGLSSPLSRVAFLRHLPDGTLLEIGPFNNPIVYGDKVSYFDVLGSNELRARAAEIGINPDHVPAVEFVSPTGDLSVVDRAFSAVISSHVVEHQPDLVAHLREVERILEPGGRYYAIVPDKRFSFDRFLPLTTLDDVLAASAQHRTFHTEKSIIAHRLGIAHNLPILHWLGFHGKLAVTDLQRADAAREVRRNEAGEYIDVHAWIFSPDRFHDIVRSLAERGAIGLRLVEVTDTGFGDLEFFAVLENSG